jgi:predicted DsbA family dithiol-disulfide isomerase
METLKADLSDGLAAGAQGTPYTVIKVGNQEAVINGAQPYTVVKGIVENLIAQLDGNFDPAAATTEPVVTN